MSYMKNPHSDNPFEEKPERGSLEYLAAEVGLKFPYADDEKTKEVQRWADAAMFRATPMGDAGKDSGPKVYLLGATADPLGTVAAVNEMYTGGVVRRLADVTDAQRRRHWDQVTKTELKSPFEFVQFHFLLDGVTRALTHQLVRQRMGTYAQESLRFAVKEDLSDAVGLPPSLAGTEGGFDHFQKNSDEEWARLSGSEKMRNQWDAAVRQIESTYNRLVKEGMPAEDARGLLPTNTLTRIHYRIDLRNLMNMAGVRLCTQAQFEWRLVWAQMVKAIREYTPFFGLSEMDAYVEGEEKHSMSIHMESNQRWQWELIADLFKPICYQKGSCQFLSEDDRTCSIRNRVQANAKIGRTAEHWDEEYDIAPEDEIVAGVGPHSVAVTPEGTPVFIGAIQPVEWLADPTAARKDGGGHLGGER